MPSHTMVVGEKHHPLSVGRDMRKPIVELVCCDLLLLAAVSVHAPYLHAARTLGVEVNEISIRRIFRTVVQTLGSGQTRFFAPGDRDGVDVKVIVALADERQGFSIRRPAMPVRRRVLRDAPGSTAAN